MFSGKFDIPTIVDSLYKFAKERNLQVSCLKKANKYTTFEIGSIIFKDVLSYSAPCSLSKYLKQWGAAETKSVFPYEFFRSVEQIEETEVFPPYDAFFSSLKNQNIPEEQYQIAKQTYNDHFNLPVGNKNRWSSMKDFLKFYNLLDVRPLVEAIGKSFDAFEKHFGVNPFAKISLPGLAFDAMFKMYPDNLPLSYSFGDEEWRQIFRNNIIGGLTTVTHRHVNLMDDESPHNSRFAPNGDRFTYCSFWDFNRSVGQL